MEALLGRARVRGSVIHDPATRSERAGVSRDGRHVGRAIARRSTLRARRRVSASLSVEPATWGTSASEKKTTGCCPARPGWSAAKNSSNTGHGLHTKIWQSEARSARLGRFGRNDHGGTSHADAQRADDREFRRAFAQNPPERATAATHHLASRPFPTKITVDRRRSPSSSHPPPTNSNPRSCSCARARTRARVRASSSPTSTPAWRSWIPSAPPWYVPDPPPRSDFEKKPRTAAHLRDRKPFPLTADRDPSLPAPRDQSRAPADWISSCTTTGASPPSPTTEPPS